MQKRDPITEKMEGEIICYLDTLSTLTESEKKDAIDNIAVLSGLVNNRKAEDDKMKIKTIDLITAGISATASVAGGLLLQSRALRFFGDQFAKERAFNQTEIHMPSYKDVSGSAFKVLGNSLNNIKIFKF